MDRLREAIELLSKLLYENASLKIKAEVFRAAKFNSVEAVVLNYSILCLSSIVHIVGLTKKSRDAGTTPGQYSTPARRRTKWTLSTDYE